MLRVRTLVTGVAGSPWYVNTYHSGASATLAQVAADKVREFWSANDNRALSGLVFDVQDDVASVDPLTGTVVDIYSAPTNPVTARATGNPLPFANQGLVRLNTNGLVQGRRVQGRLLMPGWVTAQSDAQGKPSSAVIADIQGSINTLVGGAGADAKIGVWSRPKYLPGLGGDTDILVRAGTFYEVTGASLQPKFAILRSRRD